MKPIYSFNCLAFSLLTFLSVISAGLATPIDLSVGTAAQSSTLSNYSASRAIDGVPNFTYTLSSDDDPTWQVVLPAAKTFETVTLVNRNSNCCRQRLRDITVQVVDFSGDVLTDFDEGTILYTSALLNPDNILDGPLSITVDVGGVTGNMIRVIRTPGTPENNDNRALSLDEVTAIATDRIISFSATTPTITPGDPVTLEWEVTPGVTALQIDNGVGNMFPNTFDNTGSVLLSTGPSISSTFQITATDVDGTSMSSTSISVTNEPLIYSFEADNRFSTSGSDVNLSWNVGGNITSLTLNETNILGSTGITVSPTANTTYSLVASNSNGMVTKTVSVIIIEAGVPIISEILASNENGLTDINGNRFDWIELYNPGPIPAPLSGYSLTDDEADLTKWIFPNVTIAPDSYLLVFASGMSKVNPTNELHTNFSLKKDGEYLALVKPDASTIAFELYPTFPSQRTDISYGLDAFSIFNGYFKTPTPGAPNGVSVMGFVEDTAFTFDRGFYGAPIQVDISTPTPGAQIRYTIDGTKPTSSSGLIYTASSPVNISQTTVLRAAAFLENYEPTNVDTHTYIFKSDIIAGSNMNNSITQNPTYGPQMDAALSSIPSISLTFDGNLNYEEKEVSIEMINFEDGDKQVDAGMERFGGSFTNFSKRSARINFRDEYGPGKLNFDLFENHDWPSYQPAKKYDAIELRAGNHDMSRRGAYLSNRYADDALLDMGQIAPHGRFVHVYMNGIYWGQYHLRERWNASMFSEYFGGSKDDYEAINANNSVNEFQIGSAYDGSGLQWAETQMLINSATPFSSVRSHLDVINEIDFMLLWVSGNSESEFRAAGSVPLGVPFKFYLKDADGFLRTPAQSVTHNGPLNAMSLLAAEGDPDYQILLADRIHKHFFNDGSLTPSKSIERLQDRITETELSILTECARWRYRSPESWVSYQDNLLTNQFPSQTANMITKFKTAGMYPSIDAPAYNQHGGTAPGAGPTISVTDSCLRVYYILGPSDTNLDPYHNSLDPRLLGGGINPQATMISFDGSGGTPTTFVQIGDSWSYLDDGSNQGDAWKTTTFVENGSWKGGPSELGYGNGDEATVVGYIDSDQDNSGIQKNATTYFRKSDVFIANPELFENFTLNYWFDDAIAIYINGTEVARQKLSANAPYDEYSGGSSMNNQFGTAIIPTSLFSAGDNTIAVEVHLSTNLSTDMTFNLSLLGNPLGTAEPGLTSAPIPVNSSGWLLSRTFNPTTGKWSALNEAFFTTLPIPGDSTNLVISELNYHPATPSTPEETAISTDPDDFEFIELKNIALQPVDLSGVSFTEGINFTFSPNNIVPAGGRVVIIKNKAAFEERYSAKLNSVTFGTDTLGNSEYSNKLSNGGEQITLKDALGGTIHDFTYDDASPWPPASDGPGFSLVLISPFFPAPDHAVAKNWASSALLGGNPGQLNTTGFVGDPDADIDGDGLTAFFEYALSSSDLISGDSTVSTSIGPYLVDSEIDEYLTISFSRNSHTQNIVTIVPAISEDLISWFTQPELIFVSESENPDGTSTTVYRSTTPIGERPSGREFIRIFVNQ